MARNLTPNHTYWLNEDAASSNDGKLYIFVKLTDSCMKAIETYIKQNRNHRSTNKSTIKFNLSGGGISIPTGNGESKSYSFSIAPEEKTPELFQCIKQINADQLENCAIIEQRINIHAQDDVYSLTKSKVTEFQKQEEQTKKQTKEIGESSKAILEKKTHKSSNQRSSTTTATATTTSTANSQRRNKILSNQEPHLSPNNANSSNNAVLPSAERPLRERLVHILAASSYRKPDLLLRLKHGGGVRDDEKEQLDSTLSSISTQSRTGEYNILKNILTSGEVNCDWPYYSKEEASSVRKRIKDIQTNTARPTVNKSTNDNSSITSSKRSSLPHLKTSTVSTANAVVPPTAKPVPTVTNPVSRPPTNDERNQAETEELVPPPAPPKSSNDERVQQLWDMLDKISNALSLSEKSTNESLNTDAELANEDDLDEAEKEYNRLVPQYNQLVDYLKTVSEKFLLLEQEFNEEQSHDKASKIVDEFFKHENNDGFLNKRQQLLQLHVKLTRLQKVLERNASLNDFDASDNDEHENDDDDNI